MGRNAPLTSKRCILYIYSTNMDTEYFKHALYSPFFFSLQNAVCFIMLTCLVLVLFTFYIQDVLKLKKNNSGAKGLIEMLKSGNYFITHKLYACPLMKLLHWSHGKECNGWWEYSTRCFLLLSDILLHSTSLWPMSTRQQRLLLAKVVYHYKTFLSTEWLEVNIGNYAGGIIVRGVCGGGDKRNRPVFLI